jgi:hypothetical protein
MDYMVLEKQQIVKCQDHLNALWDFDFLEKKIEDALSKLMRESTMIYPDYVDGKAGTTKKLNVHKLCIAALPQLLHSLQQKNPKPSSLHQNKPKLTTSNLVRSP